MKKIVVLGAGLTGLSTAYFLEKNNVFNYKLFEKEKVVGGLCRTEKYDNFFFDYAEHLLHLKNQGNIDLITSLLGDNLKLIERNVDIYFKEKYMPYPFQAHLGYLPKKEKRDCLLGILSASVFNWSKKKNNFDHWIKKNFGSGIAKHFMVPYNQKLWTVHPKEMTTTWMGEYVPTIDKISLLKSAFSQTQKKMGYNQKFFYPQKGGIQSLPDAFCKKIKPVYLNKECETINLRTKEVYFKDRSKETYDYLVSSMPLKELVTKIKYLPELIYKFGDKLKINKILVINLGLSRKLESNQHWIYFPQEDIVFHRQGYWTNFSPDLAPNGASSIFIEIAYKKGDKIDKESLYNKTIESLVKIGVIKNREDIAVSAFLDIDNGYVIYDKFYHHCTHLIKDFLFKNQILSIGRYGAWEYSAMEEAIEWGRNTVKKYLL